MGENGWTLCGNLSVKEVILRLFMWPLLFLLPLSVFASKLDVKTHSESALLINADTGYILYQKKSGERLYPASTTKMLTALYALKKKREALQEEIAASTNAIASISSEKKRASNYKLPSWWIDTGSSHMGIKAGEIFTFEALLHGLLIVSANDAANVIAEWTSGSIGNFVDELNQFAIEIGMKNSHFTNPHGNHHPDHYSTAEDLALLAREFLKEPLLKKIVATALWKRPETNKQKAVSLLQTNKLVRKGSELYYPKAIGVKTGSGEIAKHNLVAAATDKGRTLIAVTMKADSKKESFEDAITLFDAAFNEPKVTKNYLPAGKKSYLLTLPGGKKKSATYTDLPLSFSHYRHDEPKLSPYLEWKEDLTLPILEHQEVGSLVLKNEAGESVVRVPLYSEERISKSLLHVLKEFGLTLPASLGALFLIFLLLLKKRRIKSLPIR